MVEFLKRSILYCIWSKDGIWSKNTRSRISVVKIGRSKPKKIGGVEVGKSWHVVYYAREDALSVHAAAYGLRSWSLWQLTRCLLTSWSCLSVYAAADLESRIVRYCAVSSLKVFGFREIRESIFSWNKATSCVSLCFEWSGNCKVLPLLWIAFLMESFGAITSDMIRS